MCIIASIPAGSKIDEQTLNQMWNSNPDGGGIAWIEDGKIEDDDEYFKVQKERHGYDLS